MAMEAGGKGSFQAVKLQRPDRTTVCSHSARDMGPPFTPSNHNFIIRIFTTNGCSVVNSRPHSFRPAAGEGTSARHSPPALKKTCTKTVRRNRCRFCEISAGLNQFCPGEQLFASRLRATLKRKLKYESAHTIARPGTCPPQEDLPAAGSKGLP